MFSVYPEIVDGHMLLTETPGWGFELDEDAVGRLAVPKGQADLFQNSSDT